MRNRKIVLGWRRVTPPFFMGGAEIGVRILARRLAQAGYEVACVGSYEDPRSGQSALSAILSALEKRNIALERTNGQLTYSFAGATCHLVPQAGLPALLAKETSAGSTLITAQEGSDELAAQARAQGATTVGWLHSTSPMGLLVLHGKPDFTLATSRFVAARALQEFGRECVVFYPPFEAMPVTMAHQPRTITLVNPIRDKGVEVFLALAWRFPERQFVAVEGWFPVQLPADDLNRNVSYVPQREDMGPIYNQTRVLLVPSTIGEGFGRVVVEAGLHSVPSLVSAQGGLPEAHGGGPGIIAGFSVEEWAAAITALDDEAIYTTRGNAARRNAERFMRDPIAELVFAGVIPPLPGA